MGAVFLGGTLTVAVPQLEFVHQIEAALSAVSLVGPAATDVVAALGGVEVLGPASLFYPPGPPTQLPAVKGVFPVNGTELDQFRQTLSESDLDESGLRDVGDHAFAARGNDEQLIAVCGYKRWPARIAHLCIATASHYRQRGVGRHVAHAAIGDATNRGLLPQWRARPEASKALARSLGFEEWGFQLSIRL
ncbi:MAG: GNAT family N-acetyltransferase [Deltaproteobacteria bacterium]|nr:GNAT family N-acetyltransferase [Deltaproteobacteria bacterium]